MSSLLAMFLVRVQLFICVAELFILFVKICVAALLSHQMEQLFKLEEELRQDRRDMVTISKDVQQLEISLKRQELKSQGHQSKRVVSNYTDKQKIKDTTVGKNLRVCSDTHTQCAKNLGARCSN